MKNYFVVCANATMIRLDRRSQNIINMGSSLLCLDRRQIEPKKKNEIVQIDNNVFVCRCSSSFSEILADTKKHECGIIILTNTPIVDQLNKLISKNWIILKDTGLYQIQYINDLVVFDENERKQYGKGQTNILPNKSPSQQTTPIVEEQKNENANVSNNNVD